MKGTNGEIRKISQPMEYIVGNMVYNRNKGVEKACIKR